MAMYDTRYRPSVQPGYPQRPYVPGVITTVRVLLGMRAVVNVLWALGMVGLAVVAHQMIGAFGRVAALDLGPWIGAAVGFVVLLIVDSVAVIWANLALRDRRPAARLLLTVLPAIELVVTVVLLLSAGAEAVDVAPVAITSPLFLLVVPGMLWMAPTARWWFGAAAPAPRIAAPAALDAPTVRLALPGRTSSGGHRGIVIGAVAVTLLAVVVATGALVGAGVGAAGSAVASAAIGTWNCVPDAPYGSTSRASRPFDVVITDRTFDIPQRNIAGSWVLDGSGLSISATWSRGASQSTTSMAVADVPSSADSSSGTNAVRYTAIAGRTSTQPMEWSYSPGQFSFSDGRGANRTIDCTKASS